MLLLTRRINESIIINDNIKITYMQSKGNQIKLAIEAPREIPIHREEVYLKILADKKAANEENK